MSASLYPDAMPTFGERVKALRLGAGLTLAQAGDAAGMGRSKWHDLESGRRPNPTIQTVAAMARALDVEPHELLVEVDTFPGD